MLPVVPNLQESFTTRTLERGRSYFRSGAVLECVDEDSDGELTLWGEVSGSRSRPYEVVVSVIRDGSIEAECSCPVGWHCKHAAALILSYLHESRGAINSTITALVPTTNLSMYSFDSPVHKNIAAGIEYLAHLCCRSDDGAGGNETERSRRTKQLVFYELSATWQQQLACEVYISSLHRAGSPEGATRADRITIARTGTLSPEDEAVCRLWASNAQSAAYISDLPSDQDVRELLIRRMVATGRCFWNDRSNRPLQSGPPLTGVLKWVTTRDGKLGLRIVPDVEESSLTDVESVGGFYVDTSRWLIGPLHDHYPAQLKEHLALLSDIRPEQAFAVSMLLQEKKLTHIVPLPTRAARVDVETVRGKPTLWLEARRRVTGEPLPIAVFSMDYESDTEVEQAVTVVDEATGDQRIVVRRKDLSYEAECRSRLAQLGFRDVPSHRLAAAGSGADYLDMRSIGQWAQFFAHDQAALDEDGWRVTVDPSFPHRIVEPDGHWEIDIEEQTGWWFQLELGIDVEGERVSLLPLIARALRGVNARDPLSSLEELSFAGKFFAPMPDGRLVCLPLDRVLPLIEVLIELFNKEESLKKGRISLCAPLLIALMESIAAGREDFFSSSKLRALAASLRKVAEGGVEVDLRGFGAVLRDYQVDGLAWLQFLREAESGGILADDMGLGKTIQTLAHMCAEKAAGRLGKPFLVVCPTSVLPNWAAEARRFCPDLTVLCHHGKERAANWSSMHEHDLVVTSYAILHRDARHFIKHTWHGIVLDEAQAIKNPDTSIAKAARALTGSHRVCLTGTPIQNHLGDLWSQFEFLMPGFLGDAHSFKQWFRVPIEKGRDQRRARALSTRVKPFVVRRIKEEVAAELPSKTTIIKTVELDGAQRDLYETVRLAMHKRVLEEIALKGFNRSQIVILEAILRLRQTCCDPALVKLEAAKNVTESAKRETLMEMLSELIESGRRVLLFSQFTSMLKLIKVDLAHLGIKYVELTGSTEDRKRPVSRFQSGEVPLFLLSLKAGGTGLNLTAADTVIHYDPWWNPYVEDQATDRAHRIGQEKPVFVYKLIARGTIEDRMLELQKKKRDVAEAVLAGAQERGQQLTEADLNLFFQPISALASRG